MRAVEFLSSEWIEAMSAAAEARTAPADDPLADVELRIDQVVDDVAWQVAVDHGRLSVSALPPAEGDDEHSDPSGDVRLSMDRATAVALARQRESVLDAFIAGRIRVGGDLRALLDNQKALAAIEDVFGPVRAETSYPEV